ncbi:MAG TPA: hypothetical protein VGJ37_09320 [Pyrinomonadaceae bacterium]
MAILNKDRGVLKERPRRLGSLARNNDSPRCGVATSLRDYDSYDDREPGVETPG